METWFEGEATLPCTGPLCVRTDWPGRHFAGCSINGWPMVMENGRVRTEISKSFILKIIMAPERNLGDLGVRQRIIERKAFR